MRARQIAFWASGFVVALVLIVGVAAYFYDYKPVDAVDAKLQLQPPSLDHLFGTDGLGRDVAQRVLKGADAFFLPGLMAAAIAVLLGALAGAVAGYASGWLRSVVVGALNLIDTLPRLVFIILVVTIFPPSIPLIAAVAAILFVPAIATVIRRKVETLGSEDYILAHIAHGFSPQRILLYHILWLQCRPILIRQATYVFAYVLFVETGLSYLDGYGVQEPQPSWGNMVAQARKLPPEAYWPWLIPALAIVVTIAAFLSFGNLLAQRDEEATR